MMGLRRELHYGVTMADEGLRPISPFKLKLPPPPIMFIRLTYGNSKAQPPAHVTSQLT